MRQQRPRLFELFLLSLLLLLAGLVGLAVLVARSSSALERVDHEIVENAAPSVVALEAASVRAGELRGILKESLRDPRSDRPLLLEDARAKRRQLGDTIASYFRLPIDPGEAEARATIQQALDSFDRSVGHIVIASEQPPDSVEGLVRLIDERIAHLDAALLAAAHINAEVLTNASASLRVVRSAALPSAVGLEALCFVAAALTLVVTYRVVQIAQAADAESQRGLERRTVELEAFSGRVAHDLLSPLMTVSLALGAAEPCLSEAEHSRVRAMVSRAGAALQRVRQTISDLLDFARAGAAPLPNATVDAQAVVNEVLADFTPIAEAAGVDLRVEGGSRRRARCSAGVLRSVLSNLVENALRYMDGGPTRKVTVRLVDAGRDLRFEVEDTGPGVPSEDQQRIFEPHEQGNGARAGLGLGLATVKRLAEAHGGKAGLHSEIGRGSCFWVELPGAALEAREENPR